MTPFDKAYEDVQVLVNTFDSNYNHYMSPTYSEAEARQDFIDNFFIALGWDVLHKEQTNPYQQEVKIERSQKQQNESARKRADYAFFTAPNFKDEVFFVEAKKPSVLIAKNEQHYFQTIKYSWPKGCPVSVLTDFEEFVIVDCRQKPNIKYALNGQHKSYSYKQYADKEKFAEIYWLFSREAVGNNSLQNYAATLKKPKGKVVQKALFKGGYKTIDEDFLEYLDGIRENTAKAIKKANEYLNSEQLTEATQRIVDRLVFIRFLEDKFIEAAEHVSEWQSWADFISDCRKLDAKYNGVVFKKHFIDEPHFLGADEKLFLDICSDISNLNSPYDFNYIPIHILGSIYERFLGKIVRATDKRVFIEEKPEVRKAGGVYYTPKYIVDYIVQHTVGKIIEGLTPVQIAEKHIADIACGSGSFLIGVYDYLLDYHKKYYTQKLHGKTEIDKRSEDYGNVEYTDGQWRLTLKLKQQILLNNIYGVDIDAQAVEVTQLSLFLKMLDDESVSSTAAKQGAIFSKVLPDLSKNIVCGNSLIGFDIMNGQLFEDDELKKLNPMDYETAFPKIMRGGGFDAVVGNPPYEVVMGKDKKDLTQSLLSSIKYFNTNYNFLEGEINLYKAFTEKVLQKILNSIGYFGYIMPTSILSDKSTKKLREFIINNYGKIDLYEFPEKAKVFKNVTQAVTIYIATKKGNEINLFTSLLGEDELNNAIAISIKKDLVNKIGKIPLLKSNTEFDLLDKISSYEKFDSLKDIVFSEGEIHLTKFKEAIQKISNSNTVKLIRGDVVSRYELKTDSEKDNLLDLVKAQKITKSPKLLDAQNIRLCYQQVVNMQKERRLNFVFIDANNYLGNTCGYAKLNKNSNYNINFFMGLLNSKLLNWRYKLTSTNNHILTNELYDLPFRKIDFTNPIQKQQHNTLVELVTQMLASKKQLTAAITDSDKNFLQNKCNNLDRQIDNLVYALYGLTNEEIKIVEGQS